MQTVETLVMLVQDDQGFLLSFLLCKKCFNHLKPHCKKVTKTLEMLMYTIIQDLIAKRGQVRAQVNRVLLKR